MCCLNEIYMICERCCALTHFQPSRCQCNCSKRSGRLDNSCKYFEHFVHLLFLAPSCTETQCYWCSMGRPPPPEVNLPGCQLLRRYVERALLTNMGFSRRGSCRDPDDIWGPMHITASRRV